MAPQVFSFIGQEDAAKFKSRGTRRKIRSHIASTQHRNNRLAAEGPKQAKFRANLSISDFQQSAPARSKRATAPKNDRKVQLPQIKATQRRQQHKRNLSSSTPRRGSRGLSSPGRERAKNASSKDHTMFLIRQSDLTSQANAAAHPVPFEPWFDWLTSYWYERTMPRSTSLLKTNMQQIQLYTTWSRRMEFSEPALYYMSLLLATGIPVANGSFPLVKALWLRGKTIQAINDALNDPQRATSNALIVAMGQLALHEHIYGDRALAHRGHRLAQQKMIQLRGGILECKLPYFTLQVMIWYDKLMAAEAGNAAYFEYLPALMKQVHSYSDAEAINVTNTSSPARSNHPGYGVPDENDEGAKIGERLQRHSPPPQEHD
ncbi:hypothetical protein CKM354_001064800 [Cercospora kikuchii]|uniref:Uncharacterized protein n=1 Tax=Cercospora kikuchii TaxID=84275 RepID=A0A9P3CXA0_9PEZI|nr:uncharacterized protein CKM354_001064800 [Cercospora kikuchii]GIZ47560.1 hypothetical protein CKM354_001064800 [Cercospora kikuchii]